MLNFTKMDRNNPSKRGVMDRIKDFKEVYNVFDKNKASEQAEICIGCGDPYCHTKCPLHNIIPAWLKQTAENDLELAFKVSMLKLNCKELAVEPEPTSSSVTLTY